MRTFYLALFSILLFSSADVFAQKDGPTVVFKVRGIKKFHSLSELQGMSKGELIPLYEERVDILFNFIPYLGVTSKNGVTFQDLGIPESKDNLKVLDAEKTSRGVYIGQNTQFLKAILPYSDTRNIIDAILFYEEVLKLVKTNLQE